MSYDDLDDECTMRGGGPTATHENSGSLGRIDQYELTQELGGGGFGTVFLARDTISCTAVAVKGLPPIVKNSKEELENIRSNFAMVGKLTHTNIAKMLVLHPSKSVEYACEDVRQKLRVAPGDFLMVMEYAPGVTLSKWRQQFPDGRVPIPRAINIVRQVASALDYAHTRRIIHRDIKPANVRSCGGDTFVRIANVPGGSRQVGDSPVYGSGAVAWKASGPCNRPVCAGGHVPRTCRRGGSVRERVRHGRPGGYDERRRARAFYRFR